MEHLPPRSPDEEPHGPENERLWPGEIDLTGATRQDDALADVIGDAIAEAEADRSEVPEWGARTLARALANERDDPLSGALHHFAVTGHVDAEAMARELADLYEATTDEQIREWINWLGTYVIRLPDEPVPPDEARDAAAATTPDRDRSEDPANAPLPTPFAGKYTPGEIIDTTDARSLATVLSMFFDPGSELARFADTGDANPVLLSQECQAVRRFTEHVPGADTWVTRFEQHLASRSDLGRQPQRPGQIGRSARGDVPAENLETPTEQANPQVIQGIREHGPAFEAFLTLPDIQPGQDDLLRAFHNCYMGVYDAMDALVRDLTDGVIGDEEQVRWAAEGVAAEELVRAAWDIVELGGKLYVFSK